MSMKFNTQSCPLRLSSELLKALESALRNSNIDVSCETCLTIVFKDESYSVETGGFHPVEVRLVKIGEEWQIEYITDFCFAGNGYDAELVKEIDFDFANNYGFHLYTGECQLSELSELYNIWQNNFVHYVEMGVFQVKITTG
ncbi:DUF2787 family protein [Aliikangiella sp. IMCC44359]|uniref:DUF2787 family protein n=1 Tax=Aliikangiella sp. IMCC44359 TaxID=3459125 RepID=UPI00403ACCC7